VSAQKKPIAFDLNADLKIAPAAAPSPAVQVKPLEARKQVGARIPEALYRQLKSHAALEGKLVQDLVEQAIAEFLANRPAS
jgi:hypothetical protein